MPRSQSPPSTAGPVANQRAPWRMTHPRVQAVRPCSACRLDHTGSVLNGPPGRTVRRCANSTFTTPSSRRTTRIPVTTSRPFSRSHSRSGNLGRDALIRGLATGYEIQIDLVKAVFVFTNTRSITLRISDRPRLPAVGTLLGLDTETIYQSVQQALHTTVSTRQSRKGEISSWKAYAPSLRR